MQGNVLDELERRGLVEATTGAELKGLLQRPISLYIGFDPTSDSLHLGNLVGIITLAWFQRFGHRGIALVGGATGMIGDPSGKAHERPLLDAQAVQHNLEGIRRDLTRVLGESPLVVNNYDWFAKIGYIDFLREIGKLFRLGPMLSKEMVRTRLASDEGLSFTEFSYQTLQAYDFLHLHDECGVALQIGGSDQWGNITAGTELVRKRRGATVHGLTFPLLTRSDGKKFGKTETGTVWLSPDRLSPYEFYQYLVRIPDADVIRLMRMLTFMEMNEVREWQRRMEASDYVPNSAQQELAKEVTRIVHGDESVESAVRVTRAVQPGVREVTLTADTLERLASEMPSVSLTASDAVGTKLIDVLLLANITRSKGEGRRLIQGGGVALNNQPVTDLEQALTSADLLEGRAALLAVGKKRKVVILVAE